TASGIVLTPTRTSGCRHSSPPVWSGCGGAAAIQKDTSLITTGRPIMLPSSSGHSPRHSPPLISGSIAAPYLEPLADLCSLDTRPLPTLGVFRRMILLLDRPSAPQMGAGLPRQPAVLVGPLRAR